MTEQGPDRMRIRTFSQQILKVDESSVRAAIESGRLERSVGRDKFGRPIITDISLARREWFDRDPSRVTKEEGGERNE